MNEKVYFHALAVTSVLCLISAGIEYFSGSESFYLIMLGPSMVFIDAPSSFLQMLAFVTITLVYYSLFWLPTLIIRNSAPAAIVWGAFFLGMHFILYAMATSTDF